MVHVEWMEIFLQTTTWVTLLTLTFLEIILGIDNIIFISIVTNKLPANRQRSARNIGLLIALFIRVALLFGITLIMKMDHPFYKIGPYKIGDLIIQAIPVTGKSIILFVGGLFLIAKSTSEIFQKLEEKEQSTKVKKKVYSFGIIILQIILLDIIFSFDSILTAVGLAKNIIVMIIAVVVSMIIMMVFSGAVSKFINKHPSLQVLALSFLILIGFILVVESIGKEIPKGYVYFAIFFSLVVELINIRIRRRPQKSS